MNRSVADPDQAWILNELIRYLEHERSGAVDFNDMGAAWVNVRDGVTNRTLRANDSGAAGVVDRFGQLISFAGMRLSRKLGVEVRPVITKSELNDPAAYQQKAIARLVDTGILQGSLRVPHAIAPFTISADLRSGRVTCSVDVAAPSQGRNTTRVNWLTRQLVKSPDAVLIEAWSAWARIPGPCHPISTVRAKPESLYEDPKKELRSFTVRLSAVAGTKSGHGRGTFVGSVLGLIDSFYEQVVQHIKPWTPPAPALKVKPEDGDAGEDRDGISGELPLKSVQRATTVPDWSPPESPSEPEESLVYTTDVPPSERPPADRSAEADSDQSEEASPVLAEAGTDAG